MQSYQRLQAENVTLNAQASKSAEFQEALNSAALKEAETHKQLDAQLKENTINKLAAEKVKAQLEDALLANTTNIRHLNNLNSRD